MELDPPSLLPLGQPTRDAPQASHHAEFGFKSMHKLIDLYMELIACTCKTMAMIEASATILCWLGVAALTISILKIASLVSLSPIKGNESENASQYFCHKAFLTCVLYCLKLKRDVG